MRKHVLDVISWAPLREMKSFPSTETIFYSSRCKKYAFAGFLKFDTVPACAKTEVDLMLISRAPLHNDFVELDKMQVNIQGVEHDLQRIEQIYSRLYNNEDTLGETKLDIKKVVLTC